MKVCIAELREVANLLFDHLEQSGHAEIELESDYYWSVPTEQLYSVYEEPTDLTIGQLSDDQRELASIRAGAKPPPWPTPSCGSRRCSATSGRGSSRSRFKVTTASPLTDAAEER